MKIIVPTTTLLILLALGYWWLMISKQAASTGLLISLIIDLLLILVILIIKPFVFNGKDANNLILYIIYLATAGAIFSVPVAAFRGQIIKERHMPKELKKIVISYLAFSVLLLVLIVLEALALRGLF